MKVAIFSGGITPPTFIERLINGLSENNVEIIVFGNVNGPIPSFHKNVTVVQNPKGLKGHLFFIYRFILACFICRDRLFKYYKYQKNWPWTSQSAWYTWQRHLPVFLYLPDIFHLQWALGTENWIFLKKIFNVKFIVSLRGAHINYSPLFSPQLVKEYNENFPLVDAFHAVSNAIKEETCLYGAKAHQIKVIYSGLNLDDFPFHSTGVNDSIDCIKIISVGRPHWKKGYRYSLDAIKGLRDKGYNIEYTMIGGLEPEQWHQINQLKLQDIVHVVDRLPFKAVKEKIASSTILLLPSVEEGIANVVLEAMALGTLVVSSNCGGMQEVVKHNETGFIFPVRDVPKMIQSIEEAIHLSNNQYNLIRNNARQIIEKQHSVKLLISEMKNLYSSI